MFNISQKEKKCLRYLINEISKAERSVFEIELFLDDDLLSTFENSQTIWISYPISSLPIKSFFFNWIIKKDYKPVKLKHIKFYLKKKSALSLAFLLVLCLGFNLIGMTPSGYTNHRIAPKRQWPTFILPDSSTVILNSGSEVKYFSDFAKRKTICLKEEAFFKVTKNANTPFIVNTTDFEVKVLGTDFNANSATSDQTVSLAKGKVNVLLKESKDEIDLLPNEELVWNARTKAVTKRNFDVLKCLAWEDNILLLDDEITEDALSKINQFYGVNFVITGSAIAKQHIRGLFKNQIIDEFIISLEFISDLNLTRTFHNNIEIR